MKVAVMLSAAGACVRVHRRQQADAWTPEHLVGPGAAALSLTVCPSPDRWTPGRAQRRRGGGSTRDWITLSAAGRGKGARLAPPPVPARPLPRRSDAAPPLD